MNSTVKAFGAEAPDAPLRALQIERREPTADDVEIDILYCGVCHSDLHTVRNDWGGAKYPSVPGHEIVGKVTRIGSGVTQYKPGDTVAVGCMVDSCQTCASCQEGLEQYCLEGFTATYNSKDTHSGQHTLGGYSEKIVVNQHFVLRVPPNLNPAGVAPLLCAGITTWSPLKHWNVKKGSKVAVIGLGGLGHMALKLASALEAEVTLFTRSINKTEEAMSLGANDVILSTDSTQMQAAKNRFDLIIDTVPYEHDINPYMETLSINGTLVLVGLIGNFENDPLSTRPLIYKRRSVAGSLIGGISETQELLDFCGRHQIVSEIEMIDMQNINEAYERMLRSDVCYRFVIDMKSLKTPA